eukprot:g38856.t1
MGVQQSLGAVSRQVSRWEKPGPGTGRAGPDSFGRFAAVQAYPGIFWHQTRFSSSPFARSAKGVVPLLRYGFRRASKTVPLLAESIADGPYSRYRKEWEHRAKSLMVLQTLWPKAQGEPLYKMLQSPAAAGLPQVLVRLERVIAEMHAAGYAHNDLHAGNILVQGPQQVTVIDYDLVRPANTDSTWGDYMSLACLTFDANHMPVLENFFPEGGVRTKLASAGLERLPRLRHYAHVGRWEPLSTVDLLLFQRQHLQLLGLDPTAVSYEVEYHLPPHVTVELLVSTTTPRTFRAALERAAPSPLARGASQPPGASQRALRLPAYVIGPAHSTAQPPPPTAKPLGSISTRLVLPTASNPLPRG